MNGCTINQVHCENCGSTDLEDVGWDALRENDGYTACCNELVAHDARDCRNHHDEEIA